MIEVLTLWWLGITVWLAWTGVPEQIEGLIRKPWGRTLAGIAIMLWPFAVVTAFGFLLFVSLLAADVPPVEPDRL